MINTREIAAEYRLTHWAGIMQERVSSGLTIKAFCRQIGVCGNTYFYWQRKLREAACEQLAASAPTSSEKELVSIYRGKLGGGSVPGGAASTSRAGAY